MLIENTVQGKFLKRYKRFFADIELESGEVITAHVANTGSMKTCIEAGYPAILSKSDNPKRKLPYSLEMLHNGKTWIGVNTQNPMKVVKEAFYEKLIPEFSLYHSIESEVKWGDSRLDFKLIGEQECFVEVKNVTLLGDNQFALFPDSVSARGAKHLDELLKIKKTGKKACMLFIVQREDVKEFAPAKQIDPVYADKLKKVYSEGVDILVYGCSLTPSQIKIQKKMPFKFLL